MENDTEHCVRHFHFSKEVTYIERQEITVESGAVFYNGPKANEQNTTGATEDCSNKDEDEESLKNLIFKARLFDSNDRLMDLRRVIAHAINMAEYSELFGEANPCTINPEAQNEWYYIMKAIEEAEIAVSRMTVTDFIDQMIDWYPWLFEFGTAEEMAAFKRKLAKSISHEKGLWKYGRAKEVTGLKDMWAKCQPLGIDSAKVERMYNAAYKGLLLKLVELKQDIEKQQAGR